MTLIEDHRKKKGDDDEDEADDDKQALELGGANPLAKEESVEEDDTGGD
jgi:hypothetical protein